MIVDDVKFTVITQINYCYCYTLFSRTTWVSWYHKGKTSLDLNEARDDGVSRWQWHHLDHNAKNPHLVPDR